MDSGPVATFQVHEYLRPKVISSIVLCGQWTLNIFPWSNPDSRVSF